MSRDSSDPSLGLGVILQRSMLGKILPDKAGSDKFIGMVKERNLEKMNSRHKLN